VDDGSLVGGVVDWDDGVDSVTVDNLLLDNWLGNVVNVVVNVLVSRWKRK